MICNNVPVLWLDICWNFTTTICLTRKNWRLSDRKSKN